MAPSLEKNEDGRASSSPWLRLFASPGRQSQPSVADVRDNSTFYIILYIFVDFVRRYVLTMPTMATTATAIVAVLLWFIVYYSIDAIAS